MPLASAQRARNEPEPRAGPLRLIAQLDIAVHRLDTYTRVTLAKGTAEALAGAEAGYEYEVTTFSGDIGNCFNIEAEKSRHGPGQRLSGTLGKGNARVRIKTMNGDIELCDKP